MASPEILTVFYQVLDGIRYCKVCLRTETERKLVEPVAVSKLLKILSLNEIKDVTVCYMCEAQSASALRLTQRLIFASSVDKLYRQLDDNRKKLRSVCSYFRGATFKDIMLSHQELSAMTESCEAALPAVRARSQFNRTDTLVVHHQGVYTADKNGEKISEHSVQTLETQANTTSEKEIVTVILDDDDIPSSISSNTTDTHKTKDEHNDKVIQLNDDEEDLMPLPNYKYIAKTKNEQKIIDVLRANKGKQPRLLIKPLNLNDSKTIYTSQPVNVKKNAPQFVNHTLNSTPQAVNSTPLAMNSKPQAMNNSLQAVNSTPQAVNNTPQAVDSTPQAVNIKPQAVNSTPQAVSTSLRTNFQNNLIQISPTNIPKITPKLVPIERLLENPHQPNFTVNNFSLTPDNSQLITRVEENQNFLLHPIVYGKDGLLYVPSLSAKVNNDRIEYIEPNVLAANLHSVNTNNVMKPLINSNTVMLNMNNEITENVTSMLETVLKRKCGEMETHNKMLRNDIRTDVNTNKKVNDVIESRTTKRNVMKSNVVKRDVIKPKTKKRDVVRSNEDESILPDFGDTMPNIPVSVSSDVNNMSNIPKVTVVSGVSSVTCEKRPVQTNGRIDWEDKIPMDVISFMDATDPNAKSLMQDQLPMGVISEVRSMAGLEQDKSDPKEKSIKTDIPCIDLC